MASWSTQTMTAAQGYHGFRLLPGCPRAEWRAEGFADQNGASIVEFGTRERLLEARCLMTEANRVALQGLLLTSSTLVSNAQGSFTGAILLSVIPERYVKIGSTNYAWCTITWVA